MSLFHKEIRDGLYHIGDGEGNFCTLITGEHGAILYDTMLGFEDLKGYVAGLTHHEPMVINSHCHFDHTGGNYQFGRVYMSAAELSLLDLAYDRISTLTQTLRDDLADMESCYTRRDLISVIEPDSVIDLGGRTVKVIALPGHTAGCIGLLCQEDGILLAGDTLSPQCCIFFQESLSMETCRETIHKLWDVPFTHFLSSHFDTLFEKKIMEKFEACFDLVGKKRGMNYTYPILPDEHGKFFVLTPMDPDIGQLIGLAVKDADAPVPEKRVKN